MRMFSRGLAGVNILMHKIVESYKRKLASEDGWVLKRGAPLRLALCYPNTYAIGMANLGFQAMYEIFNNIPEVSCERVFLPDGISTPSVSEGSSANKVLGPRRARHRPSGSGYDTLPYSRASATNEMQRIVPGPARAMSRAPRSKNLIR